MSLMLEFYGLHEHPFGASPNPRYLYPSNQHREALASLISGVENQVGFAALIAEPGTGKTSLLFEVLLRFKDRASTAFLFNTQYNGLELLRNIVLELRIPGGESEQDSTRLYKIFTSFVSGSQRTKPVLIVIDEAQNLERSALETLCLMSNFETADHKLFHVILSGQPHLANKLQDPSLSQLLQRIMIISRLGSLSPMEIEECIAYRLRTAGFVDSPLFAVDAMAEIKRASKGIPRKINQICFNALELGFARRQREIGIEVIEKVLSDLNLGSESRSEISPALSRVQFKRGAQVAQLKREAFDVPVEARSPRLPSELWPVAPSVDTGDESLPGDLEFGPKSQPATSREFVGGAQSDTVERVNQIEPEAFDLMAGGEESRMEAELWPASPPIDFSLGNEVIDTVQSDYSLISDFPTEASGGLAGPWLDAKAQVAETAMDATSTEIGSKLLRGSLPVDIRLGDQVIEEVLLGLPPADDRQTGTPNESRRAQLQVTDRPQQVTSPSADPRVLEIFAPSKPRVPRVPVDSKKPTVPETPVLPLVIPIVDDWKTNVPVEQWAQGSLRPIEHSAESPPETTKPRESAIEPDESDPSRFQSGVSPKFVTLVCVLFMAALLLFTLIATHIHRAPVQSGQERPNATTQATMKPAEVADSSPDRATTEQDTAQRPVLVKYVRPVSPLTARQQHLKGDVSLEVNIAADGSVQHIHVLNGDPILAQAARDAVQQWRYRPILKDETPGARLENVVVTFR